MKILIIHAFDAYAGSQRSLYNWLSYTNAQNLYKVIVLSGDGFLSDLHNIQITKLFKIKTNLVRKITLVLSSPFFWVYLLLNYKKYDAVVGNSIYSLPLILPFFIFKKAFLILHEVSKIPELIINLLQLFACSDNTLVVSNVILNKLKIKGKIIYNPIIKTNKNESNKYFSYKKIVFVGDFRKAKRFFYFIEIAKRFKDESSYCFHAFLADKPKDNEQMDLVKIAKENSIEIFFNVKDPFIFFNDAYMFILCTDENEWIETFSYVSAEALMFNVPIIATGISVISELFFESVYFNEKCNPDDIVYLLKNIDEVKYEKCKFNASYLLDNYLIEVYSARIMDFLNNEK